jgi:hypothetical protein
MSLNKSKCCYSNNCFTFFKACSIASDIRKQRGLKTRPRNGSTTLSITKLAIRRLLKCLVHNAANYVVIMNVEAPKKDYVKRKGAII